MDENFAQKLVDNKIESLRKKKLEIDQEINKLELRDKTSLMTLRKSIIYDNYECRKKLHMGILKTREFAHNYAYAVRTNKLLKAFDEYFHISQQDIDDYHQEVKIREFSPDSVLEYLEIHKSFYDEIMFLKNI